MRIDLDDNLIEEALRHSVITSKRELIILALQEFIQNHSGRGIHKLHKKIKLNAEYNYKELRKE